VTQNYVKLVKQCIQGVSAKTFEPNISVICQRIFMKFKIIFYYYILDREGSISNNKITNVRPKPYFSAETETEFRPLLQFRPKPKLLNSVTFWTQTFVIRYNCLSSIQK
jgi:hypothetical protein